MKRNARNILCICLILVLCLFLPQSTPFSTQASAASPKLNKTKKTLSVGDTYTLKVKYTTKKVKWSSSKKSVASVKKGVVTAKKAGTCVITAKVSGKKYKCKITVKPSKDAEADAVIALVNKERKNAGLSSLSKNDYLTAAARTRAKELKTLFSHTRPDGSDCFSAISSKYRYSWLGENIAMGYTSPESVMNGWMNSPGHRSNILSANFSEIGVAMYEYNGYKYWVQVFGRSYK